MLVKYILGVIVFGAFSILFAPSHSSLAFEVDIVNVPKLIEYSEVKEDIYIKNNNGEIVKTFNVVNIKIPKTKENIKTTQVDLSAWKNYSPVPKKGFEPKHASLLKDHYSKPFTRGRGITKKIAKKEVVKPKVLSVKKEIKKSVPKKEETKVTVASNTGNTRYVSATAYSSTVDQTDSSPCIAARGFNVCKHNQENIVAANFLPIGATIKVPDLYGDKIFHVQDRMNRRYQNRVDFWMKSRARALQFGVKGNLKIEIVSK